MRKKMHTPLPPPSLDHDLHHVADDIFRRMDYSPGPINTDDVKEKHDHHHEQKKAFAQLLSGFFQKLAMGVPPPLPAAARGMLGAAKAVKPMAKPGTAAILAGAGTGFSKAPALNPFKAAADHTTEAHTKVHGDNADLVAVRRKIQAKYPDMLKSAQYDSFFTKTAGSLIERMRGLGAELATSAPMQHKAELAGLGVLAAPVGYELQKNVREGHTGDAIANTAELGGLGVLAAPAAAALRHH
jgi:hypothetical protein